MAKFAGPVKCAVAGVWLPTVDKGQIGAEEGHDPLDRLKLIILDRSQVDLIIIIINVIYSR